MGICRIYNNQILAENPNMTDREMTALVDNHFPDWFEAYVS